MAVQRIGGIIIFKVDGTQYPAKGNFTYNLGLPKREGMKGADDILYGYKETPQIPFIEGEITDLREINAATLFQKTGATVLLELSNGKMFVLRDAYYAGDGNLETEEGKMQIRFEGASGEEI